MTGLPPTLVAGVGYPDLCDHSVGCLLAARWLEEEWPAGVVVEDLSYGPIAVVHRIDEARPRLRRFVVAGAVERGRPAGTLTSYRWDGVLPEDVEELQERVAEAATGVLSLDNLVLVTRALSKAPPEVVLVVEIEPLVEELGERLSPAVEAAFERASDEVHALAADPAADEWPAWPLGGPPGLVEAPPGRTSEPRWNA